MTIIGDEAFYGCYSLTSIMIPDSVTIIGEYAFSRCSSLTSVYITDIVAWCNISFSNDDSNPLCYAHNLYVNEELVTELTIPDSVTSIDRHMFRGCSSLTSITIPNSVASIDEGAFYGCSSLTSITLPFVGDKIHSATDTYQYPFGYIFGTSSYTGGTAATQHYYGSSTSDTTWSTYYIPSSLKLVTITGGLINCGAFHSCSNLISITISDGVTSIGERAFFWCNSLTNITIPDSVTNVDEEAFSGCSKLIEVCNLSSLTITAGSEGNGYVGYYAKNVYTDATVKSKLWTDENGYTFYEDGNICYLMGYTGNDTALTLPANCNGKNYEIYQYAFYQCDSLTSIIIPNSVTSIGNCAFCECSSLTNITIPDGVTSIGDDAFMYCSSLASITIPDSVTSIGSSAFRYAAYCNDGAKWTDGVLYIGNHLIAAENSISGDYAVKDGTKCIANSAFYNCDNLTSITISNSVTSIGWYAFSHCSSLTSIIIPDSVTSIGNHAFYNCSSLTSVIIPDGVTSIGNSAFSGCSSLTSITIPDGVTNIGDYAFSGCSSLTSITIPDGVTNIGDYAFYNCSSLTSVTIGKSVTSIDNCAFYGCVKLIEVYNLSSLTITAGSTDKGYVGYHAKNVYTDTTVKSKLWTDENGYIFYEDDNICYLMGYTGNDTALTLPISCNGKNYEIYQWAFYDCSNLTSITISDSVTSIGWSAFSGCSSLTSITFTGTQAQWDAISQNFTWNYNTGSYVIHCTDGDIAK